MNDLSTLQNIHNYSDILIHNDQDEGCQPDNMMNLSSQIITIRDYISSNLNLSYESTQNVSNFVNSSAILNSTSSRHDSDSLNSNQPDIFTHILDKLNEIEMLLHEEKTININKSKCLQAEFNTMKVKNKKLTENTNYLFDQLYDIDVRLIDTEQYGRRHNLIISGIPEYVKQIHLEKTALNIISSIGLPISSYEVVGCHRLKKPYNSNFPAKTIIRFINRKVVEFCIKNRDRLIDNKEALRMNLRFYENLCESNERVFNWCRELQKYDMIDEYYTRNGFIKIIINKGDKPIKIIHPDDLFHHFQEYFDYIDLCDL